MTVKYPWLNKEQKKMLKLIVAVADGWAIGYKGDLLARISTDLKRFKELTTGNAVIMGYNTLISLPGSKPLKNRDNIVLYPDEIEIEGAVATRQSLKTWA